MAQKPFVLVTGATGFLGSHIVLQLLDAGYRVRCTARSLKARFLEEAHLARGEQFEVVEIEDLAIADLTEALNDIEAVIHSAFPAPGSMESTDLLLNGVNSTTNLLRQAYEHGIRKFVITSSYLAIVGDHSESVWCDYTFTDQDWSTATYDAVFDGTHDPAWVYAASKKLAEAAAWDYARSQSGIDLACVIPTLLIGPFAPGHAVLSTGDLSTNVLIQSLITSPTPPHPVWPHFVDVRDAATAHIQALEAPPLPRSEADGEPGSLPGPSRALTPLPTLGSSFSQLSLLEFSSTPSLSDPSLYFHSPLPSPTRSSSKETTPTNVRRKRFIASGASFTWPDVISHLRAARPDLARAGRLPDERACVALPEQVARLDTRWTGAQIDGQEPDGVRGINVRWRDWQETVEDAVSDLETAAARLALEESGWDDSSEEEGKGLDEYQ